MSSFLSDARGVLHRHFGYDDFRGGQAEAVESVLAGRDTLVVLPTGGGKSLCYQVPAQLLPGITLVLSPLISLMKDQVDALHRVGIPATVVDSTLTGRERRARLRRIESGEGLLYIAPERLASRSFQAWIDRVDVSLLAVDEAHCVTGWGNDFRPSYLRIGAFRGRLGCPLVALTATATPEVRRAIRHHLRMRSPRVVVRGFDRPNLAWHVIAAGDARDKDRVLHRTLRARTHDGVAIVYAPTRKRVDILADRLNRSGIRAAAYHAGIRAAERRRLQEAFMADRFAVVVATNAFGMGIDKSDVRLVIHYALPASVEDYYQEAGRAGRDGEPALCALLYAPGDLRIHESLIDQTHPPEPIVTGVYRALLRVADGNGRVEDAHARVTRTLRGTASGGQVGACVRVLEQASRIRRLPPRADDLWIRLIATPERIRRALVPGDDGRAVGLLRRLRRSVGENRLYRGAVVSRRACQRAADSVEAVEEVLDSLRTAGIVDWHRRGTDTIQVRPLESPRALAELRARVRRNRRRRRLQLLHMERYVRHGRCRRRFLLRYFGDRSTTGRCERCDRCLPRSDRVLADRTAPSPLSPLPRLRALVRRVREAAPHRRGH